MIICKKCKKEEVNEGHGLCLNCFALFRYHRRIYGTLLKDFLSMKRYKHYNKPTIPKKNYLKKYTTLEVLKRKRFYSWKSKLKTKSNENLIKMAEGYIERWKYNLRRLKLEKDKNFKKVIDGGQGNVQI